MEYSESSRLQQLPFELMLDIFLRLPISKLNALKEMCKNFAIVARDTIFKSLFLRVHANSDRFVVVEKGKDGLVRGLVYFVEPNGNLNLYDQFEGHFYKGNEYMAQGFACGLLLLYGSLEKDVSSSLVDLRGGEHHLVLWNLMVNRAKHVSLPISVGASERKINVGFGYNAQTDSYIILVKGFVGFTIQYHIYSSRVGSWKPIQAELDLRPFDLGTGHFLNGFIHFLAYHRADHTVAVVFYNLNSEQFGLVSLPNVQEEVQVQEETLIFRGSIGCLEETFAVFYVNAFSVILKLILGGNGQFDSHNWSFEAETEGPTTTLYSTLNASATFDVLSVGGSIYMTGNRHFYIHTPDTGLCSFPLPDGELVCINTKAVFVHPFKDETFRWLDLFE